MLSLPSFGTDEEEASLFSIFVTGAASTEGRYIVQINFSNSLILTFFFHEEGRFQDEASEYFLLSTDDILWSLYKQVKGCRVVRLWTAD